MKKLLPIPVLLLTVAVFAQTGYEIKVTLKPFKNEYIYLGHYSGKQYPIIDSVKLNDKSEGVFKGQKKLGGGIYLIAYPAKNNFFEVLIDKQQHFSVAADTTTLKKQKGFLNSPDNLLFNTYQTYMADKGREIDIARRNFTTATAAKEPAAPVTTEPAAPKATKPKKAAKPAATTQSAAGDNFLSPRIFQRRGNASGARCGNEIDFFSAAFDRANGGGNKNSRR